ncbi:MAG TPA: hypothetical protein VHY91_08800 [Pirellulales bacterium]|jgi:hypothetical protein|nr:hypothetical protein [Pirellulales bacterium]
MRQATAKQVLPPFIIALVVISGCGFGAPTTGEQIDRLRLDLQTADKGVLMGGPDGPRTLSDDELKDVVDALEPSNLRGWGNDAKSIIYGRVVFFARDVELGSINYYAESVCNRNGVYVKLARDPLKKYVELYFAKRRSN